MAVAATEPAEPILRLRGVGRRFGGLDAVSDVDLDVAHGERRAILGPNGAGKTTLFNVISGDIPATSGTITFLGDDVGARAGGGAHATRHGPHLPEVPPVPRDERRGQPLPGGARHAQGPPAHAPPGGRLARCANAPASSRRRSAWSPSSTALVGSISHGEQRQLEVGMARAVDPKLMLLDEPASGLSRGERVALTDLLLELDREHHADPHRARHGRGPARGRERHDDARRPQDRRGHPGRDPRQRARPRAVPGRARRQTTRSSATS